MIWTSSDIIANIPSCKEASAAQPYPSTRASRCERSPRMPMMRLVVLVPLLFTPLAAASPIFIDGGDH